MFRLTTVAMAIAVAWAAASVQAKEPNEDAAAKRAQRIDRLIKQLGDLDFARRERAQAELARLGVEAFDALQQAQQSEDIEVARRARYLARSMKIHWSQPGDPPEVRLVLSNYGAQSESDRASRLDRLASLSDAKGLGALCRIVRFDPSAMLSKRAALRVMNLPLGKSEAATKQRSAQVAELVGGSRRAAADWLRVFSRTLIRPADTESQWLKLANDEARRLDQFPQETNAEIVIDLMRWRADQLLARGQTAAAKEAVRRTIDLADGRRDSLINAIDWLMNRDLHGLIDELADRFPQRIEKFVVVQYRLAESLKLRGQVEQAELAASHALESKAKRFEPHLEAAVMLRERGLWEWSRRELRRVIRDCEGGSVHHLRARFVLSEMLYDEERFEEAGEVLQAVAKLIKNDRSAADRVQQPPLNRPAPSIVSRMHLFFALHQGKVGNRALQQRHLEDGIKSDRTDVDLLIAMHEFPDASDEFRRRSEGLIARAADETRKEIVDLREYAEQAPNESTRSDIVNALARANNQLAWLLCNTAGDMDEALRLSRRSLELRPDSAAFLDTLAHCYAARGDFANAVKHQSRAAELEPNTRQITRKLAVFKRMDAERRGSNEKRPAPSEEKGERKK